jgi:hypothetical protein
VASCPTTLVFDHSPALKHDLALFWQDTGFLRGRNTPSLLYHYIIVSFDTL